MSLTPPNTGPSTTHNEARVSHTTQCHVPGLSAPKTVSPPYTHTVGMNWGIRRPGPAGMAPVTLPPADFGPGPWFDVPLPGGWPDVRQLDVKVCGGGGGCGQAAPRRLLWGLLPRSGGCPAWGFSVQGLYGSRWQKSVDRDFSSSASLSVSDAQVFEVTVRILNRTVTETLLNPDSPEYRDFCRQLLHEVKPRAGTGTFPHAPSEELRQARRSPERLLCDCDLVTQPRARAQTPRQSPPLPLPVYGGTNLGLGPNHL